MSATAGTEIEKNTQALFDHYHVGWVTRNSELIASLHSTDTVFHLHDGSDAVNGRDALRRHCMALFKQYDFSLEARRLLCGADFWVFDWLMALKLKNRSGAPFTAKIEMLDVVTVNAAGEVTRKDVYANGAQMQDAFDKAGLRR